MTDITEAATEVVADAAEGVADQAMMFAEAARSLGPVKARYAALGAVCGVTTGALIGWGLAYKRLETKFSALADQEIDEMREHFRARLVAKEEKPDLEELTKVTQELKYTSKPGDINVPPERSAGAHPTSQEQEEPVVASEEEAEARMVSEEVSNVFRDLSVDPSEVDEDWDYELELKNRKDGPYVIHRDERSEKDYTETTLTYFAGDDVLCDSRDGVVDSNLVVGAENLDKFGHGSGDPTIVYVRNDDLQLDIEVVRSEGSYAHEVHGLDDHIRHSASPTRIPRRRARFDDE